jgi:hypothetical protein
MLLLTQASPVRSRSPERLVAMLVFILACDKLALRDGRRFLTDQDDHKPVRSILAPSLGREMFLFHSNRLTDYCASMYSITTNNVRCVQINRMTDDDGHSKQWGGVSGGRARPCCCRRRGRTSYLMYIKLQSNTITGLSFALSNRSS